jgi:drug/metabolite transporter (DMT)-like permease
MVPPAAALIAWLVLDESMPPLALMGMACATVGVAIVSCPAPRLR